VLAVPVAPRDKLGAIRELCDETICLEVHERFDGISSFYSNFSQVTDEEVIAIMARYPARN